MNVSTILVFVSLFMQADRWETEYYRQANMEMNTANRLIQTKGGTFDEVASHVQKACDLLDEIMFSGRFNTPKERDSVKNFADSAHFTYGYMQYQNGDLKKAKYAFKQANIKTIVSEPAQILWKRIIQEHKFSQEDLKEIKDEK